MISKSMFDAIKQYFPIKKHSLDAFVKNHWSETSGILKLVNDTGILEHTQSVFKIIYSYEILGISDYKWFFTSRNH